MALHILVRRSYGGKMQVCIKCHNLHSFKEGVILLCQSILEIRWISYLHGSALFTIPLSVIFGRCPSELPQLIPFPYSWERSTCHSDRLQDFCVTIPRCYKDVYVNSFFSQMARLWKSLPIECFPLTYDLNGFTSSINRHLSSVGSF